ncbi:MAG: hypothetical protein NVS2B9_16650 [Myxococcales bacterium]
MSPGLVAILVALASCGGPGQREGKAMSRHEEPAGSVPVPPAAAAAVQAAKADAAARTGIDAAAWSVARLEAVQWPDAGLGCPKPGAMYAQVVTPGYRIELRARDRTLEYHSGPRNTAFCG